MRLRRRNIYLEAATLAFLLAGCGPEVDPAELRTSHLAQSKGKGDAVSAGLSLEDDLGQPIALGRGTTEVRVDTRSPGGEWIAARDVELGFETAPQIDVVIVADNSGSLEQHLPAMREAIGQFSKVLLARAPADRVGLVRVSTESSVLAPLVESFEDLEPAIDEMFINRGWTALWDGIRLANEVLEGQQVAADHQGSCFVGTYPHVVVFTDGADNNSADEHETSYQGDGIDTALKDLQKLQVAGLPTAIHTVAVGDEADHGSLEALADATGGQATRIRNYGQLVGALHGAAAQLKATTPVCFVPASCEHREVRISVEVRSQGRIQMAEQILELPASACP